MDHPELNVDLDAVAGWMSEQGLGEGPLTEVSVVTGGTQNVMLRFTRSATPYVLRRGPRHLRTRSNSVILRETKVLAALAGSDVPHPHLIATCENSNVLGGAVFYLMEPVDGFNAGEGLPAPARERSRHSIPDGAVDGRSTGQARRRRPRRRRPGRFRQTGRLPGTPGAALAFRTGVLPGVRGLPGPEIPGIEQVSGWLESHRPESWTPGIMHGDYHAANVMFSRTGPDVVAIVDWEMCTIGDPLLDLGWLLATWRQPDGSRVFGHALGGQDGLASTDDLFQRYAASTSRDLSHITWYTVLACFKLGIVIEGTLARACAGKAEKAIGDQLHAATVHLFERALTLIDQQS